MKKIAVFTGTRAEYGLMRSLIKELDNNVNYELFLLISSAHLDQKFGSTINEIKNDGFSLKHLLPISISTNNRFDMAIHTGEIIKLISQKLNDINPDYIIILGDRYESFGAATAAHLIGIEIIHLHGGETTLGAVDDKLRNGITQLSNYHFTSSEIHKKKVTDIVSSNKNVYNVGPLVIDGLLNLKSISKKEFELKTGFNFAKKNVLITFHSETLALDYGINGLINLLKELNLYKCNILFTAPNADAGSNKIIEIIKDYLNKNKNKSYYVPSLGQDLYLNALILFDYIMGNSSSGIIEAPLLKKKILNIGERQKGRFRFGSVIDVSSDRESISKALKEMFGNFKKAELNFKEFKEFHTNNSPTNQIIKHIDDFKTRN